MASRQVTAHVTAQFTTQMYDHTNLLIQSKLAEPPPLTQWIEPGPPASPRLASVCALLQQASSRNPADVSLQRRLAEALTAMRASEPAIEAWRRVIAADPGDAAACRELGRLLLDARQAKQAAETFERLCALTPTDPSSYLLLARALRTVGAGNAAETAFDRAIALAPDDPACVRAAGRRLLRAGKGAELADHVQSAVAHSGWSTRLLDHLLAAHALLGHGAEAGALLNYPAVVDQEIIAPPAPYASLSEFNTALTEELRASLKIQRSGEYQTDVVNDGLSFAGGAVNAAVNCGRPTPACDALTNAFKARYANYCETVLGEGHQLHRRLLPSHAVVTGGGHFTRQTGHIAPHTHSGSWLVGVYYVAVPETAEDDESGCLKFGPPPEIGTISPNLWPRYLVRPAPGLFVLFPGYLCHWSIPIRLDEDRVVLSFDAIPTSNTGAPDARSSLQDYDEC